MYLIFVDFVSHFEWQETKTRLTECQNGLIQLPLSEERQLAVNHKKLMSAAYTKTAEAKVTGVVAYGTDILEVIYLVSVQ